MMNLAMERALAKGEAIDVSSFARLGPYYVLPPGTDLDDMDLCDAVTEEWIWSAGVAEVDLSFTHKGVAYLVPKGTHIASLVADLYQRDGVRCTWLR